jgi:AcrR family transcriptional regulator
MKQDKVESILDAAKKMFGRYGIQKTNLSEVARLARVAKATIYNYFGSKDRVYLEVLQREADDIIDNTLFFIEKLSSPVEMIQTFVHAKFRYMKGAINILNLDREGLDKMMPKTDIIRNNLFEREVGIIYSILELGVKEGIFRIDDIALTSRSIGYALRGFELPLLIEGGNVQIEEYLDSFMAVFFNGVLIEKRKWKIKYR